MRRRLDGVDDKPDFDELAGGGGLDPDEERRLRRVHDLLVQAGPPPELSAGIEQPPAEPGRGRLVHLPAAARRRRRVYASAAAAAAAVAAVFVGGFLLGHSAKPAAFEAIRVVPMHGIASSHASIRIAHADQGGNWPMLVSVVGLPRQSSRGAYYELWLSRNGKPLAACGTFRVHGGQTTVRLTVPYPLSRFDGWVVTAVEPGGQDQGKVVMTT